MGRTERRVVLAVLVTALIPLVAVLFLARTMVAQVSAVAFQPEFGMHLDRALELYADLARVTKQSMRYETDAIALRPALEWRAAVQQPEQSNFSRLRLAKLFRYRIGQRASPAAGMFARVLAASWGLKQLVNASPLNYI